MNGEPSWRSFPNDFKNQSREASVLIWLSIIIAALIGLLYAAETNAAIFQNLSPTVTAACVIAVLVAAYVFSSRTRMTETPSNRVKGFLAIIGFASAIFGLKVLNSLPGAMPTTQHDTLSADAPVTPNAPAAIRIRKRADGVFVARGSINGSQTEFIVDSGASSIMLKPSDAQKAGIDISGLAYDTPVQTAGGPVYVAPVRLRAVAVGPIAFDDLEAFVARPGSLNENLLGQNFLRRLTSYEVSGDFITLRK